MCFRVSFCSCVFQSFWCCVAVASLGEERANSAFRTFVWFVLVWICQFPLPLGVWEGLRFVIVAIPGFFLTFFFARRTSEDTFSDIMAQVILIPCITDLTDSKESITEYIDILQMRFISLFLFVILVSVVLSQVIVSKYFCITLTICCE